MAFPTYQLKRRQFEERLGNIVKHGDEKKLKELLIKEKDRDINFPIPKDDKDYHGWSLLGVAIARGHHHLVELLLQAGADPHYNGNSKQTPTYLAIKSGSYYTLQILLNLTKQNESSYLHSAANYDKFHLISLLVEHGADINKKDKLDRTPLAIAALNGHYQMVETLLNHGASLDKVGRNGKTYLHYAAEGGDLRITKLLVEKGISVDSKDWDGHTAVEIARMNNKTEVAYWLGKQDSTAKLTSKHDLVMQSWDKYDDNAYIKWAEEGNAEYLQRNLGKRDAHFRDDTKGYTPLHIAAYYGNLNFVKQLLDHGVYPQVKSYDGKTPFSLAQERQHETICNLIKKYQVLEISNSNCSATDKYEELLITISKGDDWQAVSKLLKTGAPIEPVGLNRTSALHLAVSSSRANITSLLLAAGASLTIIDKGQSVLDIAWLGEDVSDQMTAIVTRAFYNKLQFELQCLEDMDAPKKLSIGIEDILHAFKESTSPWQINWQTESSLEINKLLCTAACHNCSITAFFLHRKGGVVFPWGSKGDSPLHLALEAGHAELVRHMIQNMTGSLYIKNSTGLMACNMLEPMQKSQLEEDLHFKELHKLQNKLETLKDDSLKNQLTKIIRIYKILYQAYADSTRPKQVQLEHAILQNALYTASQMGLQLFTFLLICVADLNINQVVDQSTTSSALHQAAANGNTTLVAVLISLGANPIRSNQYGLTPHHLAAMFGHTLTYEYLETCHPNQTQCRAGKTPMQVSENYYKYLDLYHKSGEQTISQGKTASEVINKVFDDDKVKKLTWKDVENVVVNFKEGEAKEIRDIIYLEFKQIAKLISQFDSVYCGEVRLVGSTSDETRLFAPDEYDISLVIRKNIDYNIYKLDEKEARDCGYSCRIIVQNEKEYIRGSKFMKNFHSLLLKCFKTHKITDKRLALVPPSIQKTQIGSDITMSWQGTQYPLLLINVDFVPVLEVPRKSCIPRPVLTPQTSIYVYLSNTSDGSWRLSFAEEEVVVLKRLNQEQRKVFLTCKYMLSLLKPEKWMPKQVKDRYSWWDYRAWKLPVAKGFALKNSFLHCLHDEMMNHSDSNCWEQKNNMINIDINGADRELVLNKQVLNVFKRMSNTARVKSYFGGDFEKPCDGSGAKQIFEYLTNK